MRWLECGHSDRMGRAMIRHSARPTLLIVASIVGAMLTLYIALCAFSPSRPGSITATPPEPQSDAALEKFETVKDGMTRAEVEDLLGSKLHSYYCGLYPDVNGAKASDEYCGWNLQGTLVWVEFKRERVCDKGMSPSPH